VLPYKQLRGFVDKLLRRRVSKPADAEDIAQNVFQRSWQWAERQENTLSLDDWKRLIAKISFNEINRFYAKKSEALLDDFATEENPVEIEDSSMNPQFILEIAEELRGLPFRQRLSIVLHEAEILPYLRIILSDAEIAQILEISEQTFLKLMPEIPLSETQIVGLIEALTNKPCKSSIRDERCKGRKTLKRRLFGI
jgi:DNA-directed RNA polymerase specialized sigma24 family protein